MFKKINKDNFFNILPYIWLVIAFICTYVAIYLKGRVYIDSDMAGEMILSDLLNKEGGILSKNWYYSSEIRIFYLQIFYRLALLIFPKHWFIARIVGQGLWMITLILSYFFVCNKNGLNLKHNGAYGAACLMCPFGIWYFWYGAYGGAYIPHMILVLISLGLFIRVYKSNNKTKTVIYYILLALVCFINGLGGIKGFMALYVPICVATFIMTLYKYINTQVIPKEERKLLIISIFTLITAGIGYLINTNILANNYNYSIDHGRIWSTFDISYFVKFIGNFLSLFGWQTSDYWYSNVELFSINGLLGCFAIINIAIVLWATYSLIKKYKTINLDTQLIITLFLSSILIQCFIFSLTDGPDVPNASYYLTSMPLAFIVIELAIQNGYFKLSYGEKAVNLILLISISLTSIASVNTYFDVPLHDSSKIRGAYDFIIDNGYTKGCASFWNSNVITEWSNGDVEMWTIKADYDDFFESMEFLQKKDHDNLPSDEFFLLTSKEELTEHYMQSLIDYSNAVYKDDNVIILLYSSCDDLINTLEKMNAELSN